MMLFLHGVAVTAAAVSEGRKARQERACRRKRLLGWRSACARDCSAFTRCVDGGVERVRYELPSVVQNYSCQPTKGEIFVVCGVCIKQLLFVRHG